MAVMSDEVDVGRIAIIGVCSTLSIYVFIVLVRVIFMDLEEEQAKVKLYDSTPRNLAKYHQDQNAKLGGGYRWVDEKARTVHIPIDQAMSMVTREFASSQRLKPAP